VIKLGFYEKLTKIQVKNSKNTVSRIEAKIVRAQELLALFEATVYSFRSLSSHSPTQQICSDSFLRKKLRTLVQMFQKKLYYLS
jgi:hypothetical protein